MASERRKRDRLEQTKGWFVLAALLALFGLIAYPIIMVFWLGGSSWLERSSFERHAVPVLGDIVGRYIETCAYGPCKRLPDTGEQLLVRPNLEASRKFDTDFCIGRRADGGPRGRGYVGPGPCLHVIVTAFRESGVEHIHAEAVTPGYYWRTWDRTSLPLLFDRTRPSDVRISDSRYDLEYFDLAIMLGIFLIAWIAFEWIKARTWDPWRKRVKRRKRDRERRRRAKAGLRNVKESTASEA